jgi:hypothetical protein
MRYTKEQTEFIVTEYLENKDDETIIQQLAEKLDRNPRSIIGKLSREGVYEKKRYLSKTGEPPIRKKEILANICSLVGGNPEKIQTLEKAGKPELLYLYNKIKEKLNVE